MHTDIDRDNWSGEGDLTLAILDVVAGLEQVALVRVEDAPAGRAGTGYNFLANEVYVGFRQERRVAVRRMLGLLPVPRVVVVPSLTLGGLEAILAQEPRIGPADYADASMLQYLRAERIIPPYQTRGPKLVELVRVYELQRG